MAEIVRFGVSIDQELLEAFDRKIVMKGYANRSEAIRDLIRNELVETEWSDDDEEVAGTITLVYDHHVRGLNDLLLELQHRYVDLIVSTMHVHLAHDRCLEVLLIKGPAGEAKEVANRLLAVKGVIHGRLTATSTGEKLK
ncbi:MAG TPA: nickel-responsive transcriptional regulator NikR [Bacillota bacterium]|jgi:CopG family nickel-responsive transcriptional regulator|nr:nickel-responsive transcriptional regulator NikR [Bacillota bacterium]HPZ41313.1 nickel-responsive transcriptional regulator NikR [Bacillota bacterium]HQD52378.1 nickel-responsive transcriptional regulator NikR [Bacillota bacterium]